MKLGTFVTIMFVSVFEMENLVHWQLHVLCISRDKYNSNAALLGGGRGRL